MSNKRNTPSMSCRGKKSILLSLRIKALLISPFLAITAAQAGPEGGNIVAGQGNISSTANQTLINQSTNNMVVDWESFNIDANESVLFNQPSSSSATLNRIYDNNPSQINGQINANGNIFLLNANGIIFGESSILNLNGLVAAGAQMDADAFMQGDYLLQNAYGPIINYGVINAATGGVSLFGGSVFNAGTIKASLADVNLATGQSAVLDFDGDGLLGFRVEGEIAQNINNADAAVANSGNITAEGGSVYMNGLVARDVFSQVVNNSGVVRATRIVEEGGVIRLEGPSGEVENSGTLNASASAGNDAGQVLLQGDTSINRGEILADNEHGQGGSVHLLGDKVGLFDEAAVSVNGTEGGGEVLIGGDYQGGNPDVQNASHTVVGRDASISANAQQDGDGGRVIVWADGTTRFHGSISAVAADAGGNGGFAEVSGKETLEFNGSVDLSAVSGTAGTLLLDPANITISDVVLIPDTLADVDQFGDAVCTDCSISSGTINTTLQGGTAVTLQATNDISFTSSNISAAGGTSTASLTVQAGGSIFIDNLSSIALDGGALLLSADDAASPVGGADGTGSINIDGFVYTNGGTFTSTGVDFNFSATGGVSTTIGASSAAIDIQHAGIININGFLSAGTSSITLDSGGTGIINGTGAVITDTLNLQTLAGTGAVSLSNIQSGGTATTLNLGQGSSLTGTNSITHTSGDLDLASASIASAAALDINNTSGALTVSGTVAGGTGALNLSAATTFNNTAAISTTSGAITIVANSGTLTVDNSIDTTLAGGAISLTAIGASSNVDLNVNDKVTAVSDQVSVNAGQNIVFANTANQLDAGAGITIVTTGMTPNNANELNIGTDGFLNITANSTSNNKLDFAGSNTLDLTITNNGTGNFEISEAATVVSNTSVSSCATCGQTIINYANANTLNISGNAFAASAIDHAFSYTSGSGAITTTGALTLTGSTAGFSTTVANDAITLDQLNANTTTSLVFSATGTTGDVTVVNANGVTLGASTVAGGLSVTANGAISETGILNVTGTASFDASAANDQTISLNTSVHQFQGPVQFATATAGGNTGHASLTMDPIYDLDIGTSSIAGDLTVSAPAGITANSGGLSFTGTGSFTVNDGKPIILDNSANNLPTTFSFVSNGTTFGEISVYDTTDFEIPSLALTAGSNLTVSSEGLITQAAGGLSVSANATFSTVVNNDQTITLTDAANALSGPVSFNTLGTAGHVDFNNTGSTEIGTSTVNGNLAVSTANVITNSGALLVTGTSSFTVGDAQSITLDNSGNNFGSNVSFATTGTNIGSLSIYDNSAFEIPSLTLAAGSNLDVTALGGITQAAGGVIVPVNATFSTGASGNSIVLSDAGNSISGTVGFTTTGAGNVSVNNGATGISLGASSIGGNLGLLTTGSIYDQPTTINAGSMSLHAGTEIVLSTISTAAIDARSDGSYISLTNSSAILTDVALVSNGGITYLNNSGAINVTTLNGVVGVSTTDGSISLEANGDIQVASAITAGGLSTNVSLITSNGSAGDIVGAGGIVSPSAGGTLILNADGGIGIGTALNTNLSNTASYSLTTNANDAAGDIHLVEAGDLSLIRIGSPTLAGTGTQTVDITANSLVLDQSIDTTGSNLEFHTTGGAITQSGGGALSGSGSIWLDTSASPAGTAIGSLATPVLINTDTGLQLNLDSAGDIYIEHVGASALPLSSFQTLNISGAGTYIASIDANAAQITVNSPLDTGAHNLSLSASGIQGNGTQNNLSTTGTLSLTEAGGGNIGSLGNEVWINLAGTGTLDLTTTTGSSVVIQEAGVMNTSQLGTLTTGGAPSITLAATEWFINGSVDFGNDDITLHATDSGIGDINGGAGTITTTGTLTLEASQGIGAGSAVNVDVAVINLISNGLAAAGDITVASTTGLNLSSITTQSLDLTPANNVQTVDLSAASWTLINPMSLGADNLVLRATAGGISDNTVGAGGTLITANSVALTATDNIDATVDASSALAANSTAGSIRIDTSTTGITVGSVNGVNGISTNSGGNITLVTSAGDMDGTSAANAVATSGTLTLNAVGAIGTGTTLYTNNSGTGSINVVNASSVSINNSTGFSASNFDITAAIGTNAVSLTAASGDITIDGGLGTGTIGANITLTADTGSIVGGAGVLSTSNTLSLIANSGDIGAVGTAVNTAIDQPALLVVDAGGAVVNINNSGYLYGASFTLAAGTDLILNNDSGVYFTSDVTAASIQVVSTDEILVSGGSLTTLSGDMSLSVINANNVDRIAINGGVLLQAAGDIHLQAENMEFDFGAGDQIIATNIFIQSDSLLNDIVLGSGSTQSNDETDTSLHLNEVELQALNATTVTIGSASYQGAIILGDPAIALPLDRGVDLSAETYDLTLLATGTNGIIDDTVGDDSNSLILAGGNTLTLQANAGIGVTNPMSVSAGSISAINTGTGDISLSGTGNVSLGGLGGISTASGTISLTTTGNIDITGDITNNNGGLELVSTGGLITRSASGGGDHWLTAQSVSLSANSIGSTRPIYIDAPIITVSSSTGGIDVQSSHGAADVSLTGSSAGALSLLHTGNSSLNLGSLSAPAVGGDVNIETTVGNIDGAGTLSGNNISLVSNGCIGCNTQLSLSPAGTLSLTTKGSGTSGNIDVVSDGAINLSNITTALGSGQEISVETTGAFDITVGVSPSDATDSYILTTSGGGNIALNASVDVVWLQLKSSGTISIAQPVNATTVLLNSSGAISQTASITATNLGIDSATAVNLIDLGNQIDVLAANVSTAGQGFTFNNNKALEIGTVGSLSGVTTNNAAINISSAGTLTLTNAVDAGASTLDLVATAGGNITGSGLLTGGSITLDAAGDVNVTTTTSNLGVTAADNVTVVNNGALPNWSVIDGGSVGMTAVSITTSSGDLEAEGLGFDVVDLSLTANGGNIVDVVANTNSLSATGILSLQGTGIGTSVNPVNVVASGSDLHATTTGSGGAGDIYIKTTGSLAGLQLTTDPTAQTVSLSTDGDMTLSNLSLSGDDLVLSSSGGSISGSGNIDASTIKLDANGSITTSGTLTAGTVTLIAGSDIGTSGQRVITSTSNLSLLSSGSIYVSNNGSLNSSGLLDSTTPQLLDLVLTSGDFIAGASLSAGNSISIAANSGTIGGTGTLAANTVSLSAQGIDAHTNANTLSLTTSGSANAGNITITDTGDLNLNNVTVATAADAQTLSFTSGNITSSTSFGNTTDALVLNASGDITLGGNVLGSSVTLNAGGNIDGGVGTIDTSQLDMTATAGGIGITNTLQTSASSLSFTTGGVDAVGNVSIRSSGDLVINNASTDAGTQVIALSAPTLTVSNALNMTGDELTLESDTGDMTLAANVTADTLRLLSAGGIRQTGGVITTTSLGARAVNDVDLSQNNNAVVLAGLVSGSGGSFSYTDADGVEIGTVSATGDFAETAGLSASSVTLNTTAGDLTTSAPITASVLNAAVGGGMNLETSAGALNLASSGNAAAGDILLVSSSHLNTSNLTLATHNTSLQNVDITAAGITVDAQVNLPGDHLILRSSNGGNITGGNGVLTADILTLDSAAAIGVSTAVHTDSTQLNLLSAGDVLVDTAGPFSTSAISVSTTEGTAQQVAITAQQGDISVDGNLGNAEDALWLRTLNGDIVGGAGILSASDLVLNTSGGIGAGQVVLSDASSASLTTAGVDSAGDILFSATSELSISTLVTDVSTQNIDITAQSLNVDSAAGVQAVDQVYLATTVGELNLNSNLNTDNLVLDSAAAIHQTAGSIKSNKLLVLAAGSVSLDQVGNLIGVVAGTVSGEGESFTLANSNILQIGSIDGTNGIQTQGDITLSTTTGNINSDGSLLASSGIITLDAAGGIGIDGAIETDLGTDGQLVLVTAGVNELGNITLHESQVLDTSRISYTTGGDGVQTVNLSSQGLLVDAALGSRLDNLNIDSASTIQSFGGRLLANTLNLTSNGDIGTLNNPLDVDTATVNVITTGGNDVYLDGVSSSNLLVGSISTGGTGNVGVTKTVGNITVDTIVTDGTVNLNATNGAILTSNALQEPLEGEIINIMASATTATAGKDIELILMGDTSVEAHSTGGSVDVLHYGNSLNIQDVAVSGENSITIESVGGNLLQSGNFSSDSGDITLLTDIGGLTMQTGTTTTTQGGTVSYTAAELVTLTEIDAAYRTTADVGFVEVTSTSSSIYSDDLDTASVRAGAVTLNADRNLGENAVRSFNLHSDISGEIELNYTGRAYVASYPLLNANLNILDIGGNLVNAGAGRTAAAQRGQAVGLEGLGFVDAALFSEFNLFSINGLGIRLPDDQSEEEPEDFYLDEEAPLEEQTLLLPITEPYRFPG